MDMENGQCKPYRLWDPLQQRDFLREINEQLALLVRDATGDFVVVNSLIKGYYNSDIPERADQKKRLGQHTSHIELVVRDLQYIEIFRQRIEHIITIHNQLVGDESMESVLIHDAFFHLHFFQLMSVDMDLFLAVKAIKSHMNDLKDSIDIIANIDWDAEKFSSNTNRINEMLKVTAFRLAETAGNRSALPLPPFKPNDILKLNTLYTMHSERLVLDWFLWAMPGGTWTDLSQYYHLSIHQLRRENTELF